MAPKSVYFGKTHFKDSKSEEKNENNLKKVGKYQMQLLKKTSISVSKGATRKGKRGKLNYSQRLELTDYLNPNNQLSIEDQILVF